MDTVVYNCVIKNVPTYFLLCVCQIWTNFNNYIGRHVLEETFNKTVHKVHTSPKIRANTTLGNLKWQIEPSTQYLHESLITFVLEADILSTWCEDDIIFYMLTIFETIVTGSRFVAIQPMIYWNLGLRISSALTAHCVTSNFSR